MLVANRFFIIQMKRVLLIIICFFWVLYGYTQNNVVVELKGNSVLYVHGSTNLLTFTLEQYGDRILTKKIALTANLIDNKLFLSENKLSIAIKNFKSNNLIAQNEFYKLMMADKFPNLYLHLIYFVPSINSKNSYDEGIALINITITGVTRQYEIPVNSSQKGDIITLTGKKKMTIRDFGLTPPIAMLGLIKVSEWIEIDFRLYCRVNF